MDEKNKKNKDQGIINIIKNDMGEEITIHDIYKAYQLGKHKL